MSALEVTPVRHGRDLKAFIDLPWSVYSNDPNWIPPIKKSLATLLDTRKHPFWAFSERELFIARRGSSVVGRIAAILDRNHNDHHQEKMCGWGFFECMPDPEAAAGLFFAVEQWARNKGMEFLRGPLNPSMNYEVGTLVEGFDTPPSFMMTWNPVYYPELILLCGYRKEKDIYAYRFEKGHEIPAWILEQAERLTSKGEFGIRPIKADIRDEEEIRLVSRVYRECWADNWGYVPMSDEEVAHTIREFIPIFDPDMAFLLFHEQEAAGLCVIIPDINPLLKRLNGKLGPGALIKKILYSSEIRGFRGLLFGLKEAYRQLGVPFFVLGYLLKTLRAKPGYEYMEMGWSLEDNAGINLLYEEAGSLANKRYRLYRKDL